MYLSNVEVINGRAILTARFFNGRDLWCESFNGKNLSTVRNFNIKDLNCMDLQRQGLSTAGILGLGLSTVGIF